MKAYLNTMRRYATFSGRTSRRDFWWTHLILLPLMIIAFWVLGAPEAGRSVWPTLAFALIVVPHLVPWAALIVRRIHDIDRTGWWALVSLIPLIVMPPLGLVALLAWGAPRGTPGPNRYGPDALSVASDPRMERTKPHHSAHLRVEERAVSNPIDVIADLERLSTLRANGTLTAAEFEVMKAQALGQGTTA